MIPTTDINHNFLESMKNQLQDMHSCHFIRNTSTMSGYTSKYDLIENKKWRNAVAKLRCGNLGLLYRSGAWLDEISTERNCRFCSEKVVEDEVHVSSLSLLSGFEK